MIPTAAKDVSVDPKKPDNKNLDFKKIITTLLQALVTVALLYWIFHDPEKRAKMFFALQQANLWWLIPSVMAFGLVLFFTTFRWGVLLKVQEVSLSWWRTWQLVMIGMFFNLFLLGSVGGDLLKIFYAIRENPQKKTAIFSSIVFDRLVGMFSLMILTGIICGIAFSDFWRFPITRGLLTTVMLIFGVFLAAVLGSLLIQRYKLWDYLPEWLPGRHFLVDVAVAFASYAGNPRLLWQAVGFSFLANFSLFATALFVTLSYASLPGAPSVMAITKALPIVNTISALPISLSGIGVREGLFETVLHTLYKTPPALAVLISLSNFGVTVIWSLLGGIVYLFYRSSKELSTENSMETLSQTYLRETGDAEELDDLAEVVEEAEALTQDLEEELKERLERQ